MEARSCGAVDDELELPPAAPFDVEPELPPAVSRDGVEVDISLFKMKMKNKLMKLLINQTIDRHREQYTATACVLN